MEMATKEGLLQEQQVPRLTRADVRQPRYDREIDLCLRVARCRLLRKG